MTQETRVIWRLTGSEALKFLQGLVTNDVLPLEKAPGMVWAALLTPQGKYLSDFFIIRQQDAPASEILVDIPAALAETTLKRLTLYKLRADVQIAPAALQVARGIGPLPDAAFADPRHPALGWRLYGPEAQDPVAVDWAALRVAHMVPEYPAELRPDDSYILEAGFERLHGVDFRKGCYVGQEVTARMKHKTELRKGLAQVAISGAADPGTPITLPDGREAGILGTSAGGIALAHIRFDRLSGTLQAGSAQITALPES